MTQVYEPDRDFYKLLGLTTTTVNEQVVRQAYLKCGTSSPPFIRPGKRRQKTETDATRPQHARPTPTATGRTSSQRGTSRIYKRRTRHSRMAPRRQSTTSSGLRHYGGMPQ